MATKTAEYILRAVDQFSDPVKKANAQAAAMTIQTKQLDDQVKKLQSSFGLTKDQAQAAGEAIQKTTQASNQANESFKNASLAARGLGQEIGITLPRSVSAFLAQSSLIGPALSAAFSTVAVIGLVETLSQIPTAYDKIIGTLSGWNDKSKEAYKQLIEDNQRAVQELTKFQAKMAELTGGSGQQVTLAEAQQRALSNQQAAVAAAKQPPPFSTTLGRAILAPFGAQSLIPNPNQQEAQQFQQKANKAAEDVLAVQRTITEGNQESLNTLEKQRTDYATYWDKQLETFKNATFSTKVETDAFGKSVIKDWQDMQAEQQKAGDDFIKYQEYFAKQLEEFRIGPAGTRADVEAGLKVGEENAKKINKGFEDATKKQQEFIRTFQEGVGKLWDDFFLKGKGALGDLAELGKSLLRDLTRSIVEGFATSLLFGGAAGATGGVLGGVGAIGGGRGILGTILGKTINIGTSPSVWGEQIPGLGKIGGGILGAGLGGIFSASGPFGGGVLTGVGTAGAASATGITGALGLGGGAGLFGLGALTLPIVGGIVAAAGLAIAKIFGFGHHKPEEPYTRDPNDIQRNREMLFYSGAQAMADAAKDLQLVTRQFNTLPPGTLVKAGLPVALQSSNQFTRQINQTLQQGA